MLTKDLLRVSRAGGGYRPQFAGRKHRPLSARVIGTYQGHVGEPRGRLEDALEDLEADAEDFKLVRGFAALLDREVAFETRAPLEPRRARTAAFEAAAAVGVVASDDRTEALARAGESLGTDPGAVAESLYADLEERQMLAEVDIAWSPDELIDRYNLSLAQTALFDATEMRVRSAEPATLVSAVKRLRLMYEVRKTREGRELVVTGPTRLFRATRRYGTRFARLLRTVAKSAEWRVKATIDDRETERTLELSETDPIRVPGDEPIAEVSFDSGVEADFAARFGNLDLDWELVREPEPLATGTRVMIPDFALDYRHSDFRLYLEIMGFWTPEYVEKKLDQLESVEDVDLLVAVDESLGVGEEIAARDHRAIPYTGRVRLKDVASVLREYEADLVAESAAALPEDLVPEEDAVSLSTVAERHGVSADAIESVVFPEHDRIGRTLVRPGVLADLEGEIEPGMALSEVEAILSERELSDASAVLAELGYRIEWEGLGGGTVGET